MSTHQDDKNFYSKVNENLLHQEDFLEESEVLYKFLIKKSIHTFGSNHPLTANLIFYLGKFHFNNNSIHKANPLFIWANEIVDNNPVENFIFKNELKSILKILYFDKGWLSINDNTVN
jgi:hypothetical protein